MTGFPHARSHLRIGESPSAFARPPAPRRLKVLFHVYDRHAPLGRSRQFKIKETDLDELIAAAERLEARR